jgi:hypothetical protein
VRKTPTPARARASIRATPNANSTFNGTETPIIQSVFLTAGQICWSCSNR